MGLMHWTRSHRHPGSNKLESNDLKLNRLYTASAQRETSVDAFNITYEFSFQSYSTILEVPQVNNQQLQLLNNLFFFYKN